MMPNFLMWSLFIFFCCYGVSAQVPEFDVEVDQTMQDLLELADTDGDKKITVEDHPKKAFWLSDKEDSLRVRKIYHLSNLLQELAWANLQGQDSVLISVVRIKEPPADRISRRIREYFWDDLTRSIDREGLEKILEDEKTSGKINRLYVPVTDSIGMDYYQALENDFPELQVEVLPRKLTPEYVKSINAAPGLLALKVEDGRGVPFVVPGGRFNEMYGWDSYFEGIGLILDGKVSLAKSMVDNFLYQIRHYGKILNANRTYYLTRTQPPFLTSFIREVYEAMDEQDTTWLRKAIGGAITEYEQVWMEPGKRLTRTGLNRYCAEGIGIPPETEAGHFQKILEHYAQKHQLSVKELVGQYQSGVLEDAEMDQYFEHDRSIRESGHDTTWRLENRATFLNTVDLNSLLYKYEKDFQFLIKAYFDGHFTAPSGKEYTSGYWKRKAMVRQQQMNELLWNEKKGGFFDYNFVKERQTDYVSATNFYPLWAGLATKDQAEQMISNFLGKLTARGGILASSKASVEQTAESEVQRQWDYPYGWAPHQMLLWQGLINYGYRELAYELIYRWLWMITRNAVDYNGTIPEKFDVVDATHKVYAEYGNVGTQFDYITTSGFGWMNASYQLGLELLPERYVDQLNRLIPPEQLF